MSIYISNTFNKANLDDIKIFWKKRLQLISHKNKHEFIKLLEQLFYTESAASHLNFETNGSLLNLADFSILCHLAKQRRFEAIKQLYSTDLVGKDYHVSINQSGQIFITNPICRSSYLYDIDYKFHTWRLECDQNPHTSMLCPFQIYGNKIFLQELQYFVKPTNYQNLIACIYDYARPFSFFFLNLLALCLEINLKFSHQEIARAQKDKIYKQMLVDKIWHHVFTDNTRQSCTDKKLFFIHVVNFKFDEPIDVEFAEFVKNSPYNFKFVITWTRSWYSGASCASRPQNTYKIEFKFDVAQYSLPENVKFPPLRCYHFNASLPTFDMHCRPHIVVYSHAYTPQLRLIEWEDLIKLDAKTVFAGNIADLTSASDKKKLQYLSEIMVSAINELHRGHRNIYKLLAIGYLDFCLDPQNAICMFEALFECECPFANETEECFFKWKYSQALVQSGRIDKARETCQWIRSRNLNDERTNVGCLEVLAACLSDQRGKIDMLKLAIEQCTFDAREKFRLSLKLAAVCIHNDDYVFVASYLQALEVEYIVESVNLPLDLCGLLYYYLGVSFMRLHIKLRLPFMYNRLARQYFLKSQCVYEYYFDFEYSLDLVRTRLFLENLPSDYMDAKTRHSLNRAFNFRLPMLNYPHKLIRSTSAAPNAYLISPELETRNNILILHALYNNQNHKDLALYTWFAGAQCCCDENLLKDSLLMLQSLGETTLAIHLIVSHFNLVDPTVCRLFSRMEFELYKQTWESISASAFSKKEFENELINGNYELCRKMFKVVMEECACLFYEFSNQFDWLKNHLNVEHFACDLALCSYSFFRYSSSFAHANFPQEAVQYLYSKLPCFQYAKKTKFFHEIEEIFIHTTSPGKTMVLLNNKSLQEMRTDLKLDALQDVCNLIISNRNMKVTGEVHVYLDCDSMSMDYLFRFMCNLFDNVYLHYLGNPSRSNNPKRPSEFDTFTLKDWLWCFEHEKLHLVKFNYKIWMFRKILNDPDIVNYPLVLQKWITWYEDVKNEVSKRGYYCLRSKSVNLNPSAFFKSPVLLAEKLCFLKVYHTKGNKVERVKDRSIFFAIYDGRVHRNLTTVNSNLFAPLSQLQDVYQFIDILPTMEPNVP